MKPTPHYRYATARKQLKIAPHGSIADCREPERSSGCDRHTLFHFHSADPPDSPFGHNRAAVVSSEVQCPVSIQKVSSAASRHASSFRRYKRYKQYKPKPGPVQDQDQDRRQSLQIRLNCLFGQLARITHPQRPSLGCYKHPEREILNIISLETASLVIKCNRKVAFRIGCHDRPSRLRITTLSRSPNLAPSF